MSHHTDDHLRNACQDALVAFRKTKNDAFAEIQSKIEFCLGSFDYDHNPSGLVEFGRIALALLKEYKSANPRKVNKSVIEGLEASLQGR